MDQLVSKTGQLLEAGDFKSIGLSGGVANNQVLRAAMKKLSDKKGIPFLAAEPVHTGDNAVMIAFASHADPFGFKPGDAEGLTFHPSMTLKQAGFSF
jgi:N6-L-threonylcarbamoyladenine synthase